MDGKLRHFGTYYCQKVLPLVYDDSLSYYEVLCKVRTKLNEMIDYLNNLKPELMAEAIAHADEVSKKALEDAKIYTDGRVAGFGEQVDNLRNDVTNEVNSIRNYTTEALIEVNKNVAELWLAISDTGLYIDNKLSGMKDELIEYINEHIVEMTTVYVFNPFNGQFDDIQTVVNDLFASSSAMTSLTAQEYDDLQLTAYEYDGYRITAKQYITGLRNIFHKILYDRMLSPFTGTKQVYDDVISRLADFHKNAYNASEYDAKRFNVNAYDGYHASAYNYDWNGKGILI